MIRTIPAVVLSLLFATAALASSRVRLDEGAPARQTRLATSAFEAHIYLTLQQGQTTGSGQGVSACTGGQVEVPLTVPAQGPAGFQAGPATANVEAVVREKGTITEDQHWTRAVTISIQP